MRSLGSIDHNSASRRWWTLSVLCLSLLIVSIQTSILNVALPALVRDLGADNSQLQWIVDADVVAFAGMLLTGAALADRYGRRRVMTIGLIGCGIASAAAALSNTPGELIAWRAVTGVASALVMPATLSILVNVFTDRRERSKAIAIWSLMNAGGAFVGPIAGGALLAWTRWNACFYVIVPFVVVAAAMSQRFVPESRDPEAARFDVMGAVSSTVALGFLVWAIIEAPSDGWGSRPVVTGFVVAAVAASLFLWWERRAASPMLDLAIFRNRQLSAAVVALTIAFLAMTSAMYLAGLALQLVKGYSPLRAAIATSAPITLVNLLVVPAAPALMRRFGARLLVSGGIAVIALSTVVIASMTTTSPYWPLFLGFALMALAFSTFVPASTETIMAAVPPERSGGASAANQLTRQVGQALGVALGGGLAAFGYRSRFHADSYDIPLEQRHGARDSLSEALGIASRLSGRASTELADGARIAYLYGLRLALLFGAVAALLGALYAAVAIPAHVRVKDDDRPALGEAAMPPFLPAEP